MAGDVWMTCIGCAKLAKRLSTFRQKIMDLEDQIQLLEFNDQKSDETDSEE